MPAPSEAECSTHGEVYFGFQHTAASQIRAKRTQSTDHFDILPVAVNTSGISVFDMSNFMSSASRGVAQGIRL